MSRGLQRVRCFHGGFYGQAVGNAAISCPVHGVTGCTATAISAMTSAQGGALRTMALEMPV